MLHVFHGFLLFSITDGGAFIAEGTRDNDTLNWLDLTSNNIGGKASMVFANALEQVRIYEEEERHVEERRVVEKKRDMKGKEHGEIQHKTSRSIDVAHEHEQRREHEQRHDRG